MNKAYTTVIFDYGGVIIPLTNSRDYVASAFGLTYKDNIDDLLPLIPDYAKGKITEFEFWQRLSAKLNQPVPKNYQLYWRKNGCSEFSIYWPVIQMVRKLNSLNITTAILSNVIDAHAEISRQMNGYQFFDHVFLSYELGFHKPEIEFYQHAIKAMKVDPTQCIYIDDLEKNLIPAQELGMTTIQATNPFKTVNDIKSLLNI